MSTTDQTTENQERELRLVAERKGYAVVQVYRDNGISGAKGRNGRPGFDELHKAIARREIDVVMAWSVDRLGRSLQDLVVFLDHVRACGVELFLHQQGLDTLTPSGRALFGMLSVFSEFERAIIVERVRSGMARARERGTRSGRAIGRPKLDPVRREAIRAAHAAEGGSLRQLGKRFHLSPETVRKALAGTV